MADPSPLKTLEEGVPRAMALAQLEQARRAGVCSTHGVSIYGLEGGLHAVMTCTARDGEGEWCTLTQCAIRRRWHAEVACH